MSRHVSRVLILCMVMAGTVAAASAAYRLPVWPTRAASPDFSLLDTAGRVRTLADFRGKAVVLFFGFLHCPDACPTELYKLSLTLKALGDEAQQVQVLFVTLDPQRDSPALLEDYTSHFDARFIGLTGSVAQINQAAANFHVEFAKVAQGEDYTIDHSTSTYLFAKDGKLRVIAPAQASIGDLAHDLDLLARE